MSGDHDERPEPEPGPAPEHEARKDRLVQTRVPRDLESTLKREARRRRLSVSHLIRNVLEDAFQLVDDVVANVDEIVNDSVELARRVKHDARRIVGAVRDAADASEEALDHVYGWSRVVLNRAVHCARCAREIARGAEAWAGLSDDRTRPRAWLCGPCREALPRSSVSTEE